MSCAGSIRITNSLASAPCFAFSLPMRRSGVLPMQRNQIWLPFGASSIPALNEASISHPPNSKLASSAWNTPRRTWKKTAEVLEQSLQRL